MEMEANLQWPKYKQAFFKHSVEISWFFYHSTNAKFAILTHLEALNFDFYEFFHFMEADIYQIE